MSESKSKNYYKYPSWTAVKTTPYVAMKEIETDEGKKDGVYKNMYVSPDIKKGEENILLTKFKAKMLKIIETQWNIERSFLQSFIDKISNEQHRGKLQKQLNNITSYEGGSFSILLTAIELMLNDIYDMNKKLEENLAQWEAMRKSLGNKSFVNEWSKVMERNIEDAWNKALITVNWGDIDQNITMDQLYDKFIENLKLLWEKSGALNYDVVVEALNKTEEMRKDVMEVLKGKSDIQSDAIKKMNLNDIKTLKKGYFMEKAKEKKHHGKLTPQMAVWGAFFGVINGKLGEFLVPGAQTGQVKKMLGSTPVDIKFDNIQTFNWDLQLDPTLTNIIDEVTSPEGATYKLWKDVKKSIEENKNLKENAAFLVYSSSKEVKEGGDAKIIGESQGFARWDDIKNLSQKSDGDITDIDEFLFMLVNTMPGAVHDDKPSKITAQKILQTLISRWLTDQYTTLMSEDLNYLNTGANTKEFSIFRINGIYYTLSNILFESYKSLSADPESKTNEITTATISSFPGDNYYKSMGDNVVGIDRWEHVKNESIKSIKFARFNLKTGNLQKALYQLNSITP